MNTSQAELLAKIAMHIRTVPVCYTGRTYPVDDCPVCLIGNALKAGIIPPELAEEVTYAHQPYVTDAFGVDQLDFEFTLLGLPIGDLPPGSHNKIPGTDYYNAIVSLMSKYDQLHVLRRMEGTLDLDNAKTPLPCRHVWEMREGVDTYFQCENCHKQVPYRPEDLADVMGELG